MLDKGRVQSLTNRDAVVAFFARFGYNVNARLEQTAANLGVSPESTVRRIRHIERIANQEDFLQVYLFEVDSVTVDLTRSLARTFRDFHGHYLLVLTSDYEQIDFVLVETLLASGAESPGPMQAQRKRGFRPLVLSVNRRAPRRVDLRVLARFEYTEADPQAQYDKLLSAYSVAFWSEEHFNNRALFSDYYLVERLRDLPEWSQDIAAPFGALHRLLAKGAASIAGQPEAALRTALLLPAFEVLGFVAKEQKRATDDVRKPDYALHAGDTTEPVTFALTYCWNRNLDGPDDTRDPGTPHENPSQNVVTVLEKGLCDWAIVTNGKIWRLYSKKAHSRATNYYEVDLPEIMALPDPSEAFRYFWLFFGAAAFVPRGETESKNCFLDDLLDGSQTYAKKLGERLKDRVFREVYMKALYEYFKDDLEFGSGVKPRGTAVELAEFQEDAVRKARKILAIYNGVMIADSVGLGKTWIGKRLLEDFAYHLRQKALVVCPASLRDMWQAELTSATIAASFVSQEEMGREDFPVGDYGDADIILVDESHNFRNTSPRRYETLEAIIGRNGGRGHEGERKKIILLTATPISNDILDLYNQINLIAQGDASFFSAIGIGDLRKYFLRARREKTDQESTVALFNLLEEVVVRRTRPFIKRAYPDATIRGKKVKFPERRLKSIRYDLERTYQGIYRDVVTAIENLNLAPYNLESFKKEDVAKDIWEEGRQAALVGIFKSRFLKRFESSVYAFRISVQRALQFQKTFEAYLLDGRLLDCADFRKAMQFLASEDIEDDCSPVSLAERLEENEDAKAFLAALPTVRITDYNLKRLHEALQQDIEALQRIWNQVKDIDAEKDTKVQAVKDLLGGKLKGKKVLIFSYYKDTARYLERVLKGGALAVWRRSIGDPVIRRMDSGNHPHERTAIVKEFAPVSNDRPEI